MKTRRRRLKAFTRIGSFAIAVSLLGLTFQRTLLAFNYVVDANGTYWGIQDAASPRVDTGSIRATQIAPGGNNVAFSTQINGFGGIKVLVEATRPPRFNGELMRGFGLTFDGVDRFATTSSVGLGGVTISRAVFINRGANYGRWIDSFTNTSDRTVTIKVAFGGQSGIGTAAVSTAVVNTSSGDTVVTAADSWVEVATPLAGATLVGGPQIAVIGTPSTPAEPFSGAMTFAGNWLLDSFNDPLVYTGHEANFQAYVNTLTIPPGKSRSLLHFIVLGPRVDAATSAGRAREDRDHREQSRDRARHQRPDDRGGLHDPQLRRRCAVGSRLRLRQVQTRAGREGRRGCASTGAQTGEGPALRTTTWLRRPSVSSAATWNAAARPRRKLPGPTWTGSPIYDKGQFGFNAFEIVAADAMKQARAADRARARGASGPLLGIPIAIKNNYDTFDMADHQRQLHVRGIPPRSRRVPGGQAARSGRRDHRQDGVGRVRDVRPLVQ